MMVQCAVLVAAPVIAEAVLLTAVGSRRPERGDRPAFVAPSSLCSQRESRSAAVLRRPGGPRPAAERGRWLLGTRMDMGGAGQEDGLRMVEFGKTKKAGEEGGVPSETDAKKDAEPAQSVQPNQEVLDALSVSSWWKHDSQHRTTVEPSDVIVDYNQMLGDGTYGEVFLADFINGKHKGKQAVAKRAKDGMRDPLDPVKFVKKERSKQMEEHDELAAAYLSTEGYINDLVMESCPETCAPYMGMMEKKGKRWLLWEYLDGTTLEDLLLECDECYSLQPLAKAIGIDDFVDGEVASLRTLVNKAARQLLAHCMALEKAGVAHRDIKPFNIFVTNKKLLLIDFGSAAAMGIRERIGYVRMYVCMHVCMYVCMLVCIHTHARLQL